jgi:hypothetical protein
MKMRTAMPSQQGGFSLLTGFVLAIVMFGSLAFFLAGQGVNASFGSTYSNQAKASSLLTSAGFIKTGFDSALLNGTTAAGILFDDSATTVTNSGIFNPNTGGAIPQTLDSTLFVTGASYPYWIYRGNMISLQNVGGTGNTTGEYTVIAPDLKLTVCQQINTTLSGTATPPTLTAKTLTMLITGDGAGGTAPTTSRFASVTSGSATDLSALTGTDGKRNGCFVTSDTKYVYIHTLMAQ